MRHLFVLSLLNIVHGGDIFEIIVLQPSLIPCNLQNVSDSERFFWRKDEKMMEKPNILRNGSLSINKPRAFQDSGKYECCTTEHGCTSTDVNIVLPENWDILRDTADLNRSHIYEGYVYWLPEMTRSLRTVNYYGDPITFVCYFLLRSKKLEPQAVWLYQNYDNELVSLNDTDNFNTTFSEYDCVDEMLSSRAESDGYRCFQTTLIASNPRPSDIGPYICQVSVYDKNTRENLTEPRNELAASFFMRYQAFLPTLNKSREYDRLFNLTKSFNPNESLAVLKNSTSVEQAIATLNNLEGNKELRLYLASGRICAGKPLNIICYRPHFLHFGRYAVQIFQLDSQRIADFIKGLHITTSPRLTPLATSLVSGLLYNKSHRSIDDIFFLKRVSSNASFDVIACTYTNFFTLAALHIDDCDDENMTAKRTLQIVPGVFLVVFVCVTIFVVKRRRNKVWKTVEAQVRNNLPLSRIDTSGAHKVDENREEEDEEDEEEEENEEAEDADGYLRPRVDRKWELPSKCVCIGALLANGSFGPVHLARLQLPSPQSSTSPTQIKRSEVNSVVKILKDTLTPENVKEFANEISLLRFIGPHPDIIQLLGCSRKAGRTFHNMPMLVLEYATRGSIHDFFRRHLPPRKEKLELRAFSAIMKYSAAFSRDLNKDLNMFASGVARAMAYLEDLGVVHGDLAARNVLLTADFHIKLADFGLSTLVAPGEFKVLENIDRIPFRWCAPEVHANKLYAKSDVWSFGVFLWELFTLVRGLPYSPECSCQSEVADFINSGRRLERPFLASVRVYELMRSRCWKRDLDERCNFAEIVHQLDSDNFVCGYLKMGPSFAAESA